MTPERWRQVTEIFHSASEQPPSQVEEFLRGQCGGDAEMYAEVIRMLQEDARTGPLDRPLFEPPSHASAVFADGQIVSGRYRIVRFLSRGGMGEVYEAEDQDLKEHVALKTLLPAIAADARMIARFKQEIQLSRKISHPNVCNVHDLARHPADGSSPETTLFLTMEFLPGETLAARLDHEGRMACDAALPLLRQMAGALDAAHRAGVIHRDFKPSNVMLVPSPDGVRAVVTDFGLARSFTPSGETTATRTEGVAGTLDYMAPELLAGQSASAASDVYALGMVAYKMVTGALPFASDTPLAGAILRSKAAAPSPRILVPGLDPKWERAILRALDRDRMRRFSRPSEFIAALAGEAPSMTVSLPVMTRRRWVAAAVVVVAAIAGWLGWRAWVHARSQPPPEAEMLYRKGVDDIHAGAYFAATKALTEAVRVAPHFGLAHARLAEAWLALDVSDSASHEMLLALGEDTAGLSSLDRLQLEAVHRTVTREFPTAVARYEQMHQAAPEDGAIDLDLGRAYESASQPDKAIDCYRRAAEGPAHNPAAWLRLAVLYDRRSDAVRSDAAFQQAERLYQLTSNLEGLTQVAFVQGSAADGRHNFEQANGLLEKALETARLAGNVQQEIRARLQFANHYYQLGDTPRAEQYAREALDIAQANQMEYYAISGLTQLGNAYSAKTDFQGAEKQYNEALSLARRTNAQRMVAVNLLSLAALHDRLGRSEGTARESRESLAFYQLNGFPVQATQCLVLLGRAQRNQGDLKSAQDSFQQALQVAEKSGNRGSLALAHESLASLLSANENYPEALKHYQKNFDLSSDARTKGSAGLLIGSILSVLGNYDDARKMLDAADAQAASFPSLRLDLTRVRADMALSEGRYSDAVGLCRRALATAGQDAPLAAALQKTLGLAQVASGNNREGLRNCEESLRAAEKLGNVGALLTARLALAQVRLETGDGPGALSLLEQAEPELRSRPESRWRAFALKSRVDPQSGALARQALDELHGLWGDSAFQRYLSRPDVRKLALPLLLTNSAKE